MAVELQLLIETDITVGELRHGAVRTIHELTGNTSPMTIVWNLIDGAKIPSADEMSIIGDGLIILEIMDFDSQVVLNIAPSLEVMGRFLCDVSAEYSRDAVEVTLAVACAIWLARRSKSTIGDDWAFWTNATRISPDELVEQICVIDVEGLEAACKRLVGSRVVEE